MTIKRGIISAIMLVNLASCAEFGLDSQPAPTALEIQSIQTREYDSKKDIVFPSVVSVFQDLGYSITNADIQTGLISAESIAQSDFMFGFDYSNSTQTKATAFIEQIGKKTRVRVNFVQINQMSSEFGQNNRNDEALLDPKLYQNAFEKIENAIFIRTATN